MLLLLDIIPFPYALPAVRTWRRSESPPPAVADGGEVVPDRLTESYDRLLLALERLVVEVQWAGDAGVREWASLAMLEAIDFAEELWLRCGVVTGQQGSPGGARGGWSN